MKRELLETIQDSQVSLAEARAANLYGLPILLIGNVMGLVLKAQVSDTVKLLTMK